VLLLHESVALPPNLEGESLFCAVHESAPAPESQEVERRKGVGRGRGTGEARGGGDGGVGRKRVRDVNDSGQPYVTISIAAARPFSAAASLRPPLRPPSGPRLA